MKKLEFKQKITLIVLGIFLLSLIASVVLRIFGIDTLDIFNVVAWITGGQLGFYVAKATIETVAQEITKQKTNSEGSEM